MIFPNVDIFNGSSHLSRPSTVVTSRSENCRKFSPANRRHHNWEPIDQSFTLRVTNDAIGQCG